MNFRNIVALVREFGGSTSTVRASDVKSGFHFWDRSDAPFLEERIVPAENRVHFSPTRTFGSARCAKTKPQDQPTP